MTKLLALLVIIFLAAWIQQTDTCHVMSVDEMIRFKEIKKQIEEQEKEIEELEKLYNEEEKILQQEPDYFTQEDVNLADVEGLLAEDTLDYTSSVNDVLDEDYPEFPAIEEEKEFDYPEFRGMDEEETDEINELEVYSEKYDDFYDEYLPNEKREKRNTEEVLEGIVESGGKLFSGNIVGSITTFLKTLARPVFH